MRHESVTIPVSRGIDWKGIGYLFSIVGTLALGAAGCFAPHAPAWYFPVLGVGVITSLVGFAVRYIAHLKQQREIRALEQEAEKR